MIAVPRKRRYRTLKQKLSRFILSMAGWKVVGSKPDLPKYVMIGYPHTSNWDFPIGLLIMTALGFELHWIGKSSLFRWPMGWLLRKLGGVPINRSTSQNFVEQAVTAFREHEKMTFSTASMRSHRIFASLCSCGMGLPNEKPLGTSSCSASRTFGWL